MDDIKVVEVINEEKIVINKGKIHGIKQSDIFIIYDLGKSIIDPITKEDLGQLEHLKGVGVVSHIQDKMTTLVAETKLENKTIENKKKPASSLIWSTRPMYEEVNSYVEKVEIKTKFEGVQVGDKARLK